MICYRVDRRLFQLGQEVHPPGDHIDHLTERVRRAELLIRETIESPGLRDRYLYVFKGGGEAWRYWLHRPGRNVYAVRVIEADILHAADTRLISRIAQVIEEPEKAKELAEQYRAGYLGNQASFIELIVRRATVVKVLHRTRGHAASLQQTVQYAQQRP